MDPLVPEHWAVSLSIQFLQGTVRSHVGQVSLRTILSKSYSGIERVGHIEE